MANFYKPYIVSNNKKAFSIPISNLGAPTNPMVAKQLEEFGKLLNQGIKNIEVGTIAAEKFEYIPDQHFEEIRRLAKITDSNVSVHAPLIDLAGFPEQGQGRWSEDQRKETEERLYSILQRSFKLTNKENVPVVFHAGHMQSQEYQKDIEVSEYDEEGNLIKQEIKPLGFRSIVAVNQDTGEVRKLDYEKKFMIGKKKEDIWDPMKRLHSLNSTHWDEEKLQLLTRQQEIQKIREKLELKERQNEAIKKAGLINDPEYNELYKRNLLDAQLMGRHIEDIHQKVHSEYQDIYNKFTRFASEKVQEKHKEKLEEMKKFYGEKMVELNNYNKEVKKIEGVFEERGDMLSDEEKNRLKENYTALQRKMLDVQLDQTKVIVNELAPLSAPNLWRYVGEFAIEKSAETVASAMARMYTQTKKQGKGDENKIPFVAMENFFTHSPMSTAKDLKEAVFKTRELLAEKLAENKDSGLSKKEAEKIAEQLVGATWDVGHINNLRKSGFEGEELKKKVIEESKEIAEVTRHVHITDNFGFHDSHLPPGMGNVPISAIMEELEKKWSELHEQGKLKQHPRGIVEAGGFVGEIGQNPTLAILEYFASPLSQAGHNYWGPSARGIAHTYSPYLESFIEFPQQHFSLYGSSFTTLPKSVGGQVGNESSRFSGTPNQ